MPDKNETVVNLSTKVFAYLDILWIFPVIVEVCLEGAGLPCAQRRRSLGRVAPSLRDNLNHALLLYSFESNQMQALCSRTTREIHRQKVVRKQLG